MGPHRHPALARFGLHVYSGSTKGVCGACGCEVWIGPRSLVLVEADLVTPVCDDCELDQAVALREIPVMMNLGNPEGQPPDPPTL